jgi:hypothetical protein
MGKTFIGLITALAYVSAQPVRVAIAARSASTVLKRKLFGSAFEKSSTATTAFARFGCAWFASTC